VYTVCDERCTTKDGLASRPPFGDNANFNV
jgi:hypothetical protein